MAAMVSSSLENHVDLNGNSDKYSDSIHGSQPIKEGEDDDKGWIRVEKCRDQGKSGACPSATTHPNRVIRHQGINKNASDEGRANSFTRKQGSSFSIQSPLCFVPGLSPSSWKDACMIGGSIDDNCKLEYISPSLSSDGNQYASIAKAEIESNARRWENTLIGMY